MASEAPSWADHWGAGGIGAMPEEDNTAPKKESSTNKKGNTKAGLHKAMIKAHKIKNQASTGVKWVKNLCKKKKNSSSDPNE